MIPGSIDCHVHILDPARYPYAADTVYRPVGPETAPVERYLDLLAQTLSALLESGALICVDHCGRPDPTQGLRQAGFEALLELGRQGHAVKLSGPFRFTHDTAPFRDTMPYIEALLRTFTPAQCCWGSDWPYLRADSRLDYAPGLKLLETWLPDAADRAQVLRDTPRRLFGFAPA